MVNPIDKVDEWLKVLRRNHPLLGWTITILAMPIALLIGVGSLLLGMSVVNMLVGVAFVVAPVTALILLAIVFVLMIIKRESSTEVISKIFQGTTGIVIVCLSIVIAILLILLFLRRVPLE